MNSLARIAACVLAVSLAAPAWTACTVTETKRQFEGAERTILTLENERIIVEVVPEVGGKIVRYESKERQQKLFSWLDDCPYHYMCRWEGKPFTWRVEAKGPEKAVVSVMGGGKIAVSFLRGILGAAVTNPLDLGVERTMTIEPNSTRLKIDVKITNAGDGIAPELRYMVHAVYEFKPPAFWFIPTEKTVEVFSDGRNDMWAASGTPDGHPFNRFTGRRADKPRFEPMGWSALHTGSGYTYISYEPGQTNFMQYWYGGYGAMFTFEPHSKPVDLRPGESTRYSFSLYYDAKEVPFQTKTTAFEPLTLPPEASPDVQIEAVLKATTVRDAGEAVKAVLVITDPKGAEFLKQDVVGEVKPFEFTAIKVAVRFPADAALGKYAWSLRDAADGKEFGAGAIELVAVEEMARRRTERAVADMKRGYEEKIKGLDAENQFRRKRDDLWKDSMNVVLSLRTPALWPAGPEAFTAVSFQKGAVEVLGRWEGNEAMRIKALARAPQAAWPADPDKLLAALKADRALVRDIATTADGKGVVALLVDAAKNRVEVVRLGESGVLGKFGRCADQPGETDDALGTGARALAVDQDGNIWVATNAWGSTSVFQANKDGQPYEAIVTGAKGALKKFAPDGKLLGTVSLLETPMDLCLAAADGTPVVLTSYRHVSAYHGAMVREGVLVVAVAGAKRLAEIKLPGGSLDLDDQGRIWVADVAGHVACFSHKGQRLLDVASSPAPAVLDSQLPPGSPLPAVVRNTGEKVMAVLFTFQRRLNIFATNGAAPGIPMGVPDTAGVLRGLKIIGAVPLAVGEKGCWMARF